MLATELFGLEIYRINTLSFGTFDQKEESYSVILRGESYDFSRLLAYLTLYTDDFVPLGIYKNLE